MMIAMIRSLLLYCSVLIAVRLMGKRQISELQTSELVVTLLISDIAAIPMQDTSQPLVSGLLPIAVLVAGEILLSISMMKSGRLRRLVCGNPVFVIRDGKIEQRELRRLRLTVEDLFSQLRSSGVTHLEDVAYGIIETDGSFSVIRKPGKEAPTCDLLQLPTLPKDLEVVVVSDGIVIEKALSLCGKSRRWLDQLMGRLQLQYPEIFVFLLNTNGSYQVIKKERP